MAYFPSFSTILSNIRAAITAYAPSLNNFGPGGVLYALTNTTAEGIELLQSQTLDVLANSRLSTADDAAADTFFAQFNFARLPAVSATGLVTFARYVAASAALITPGAIVKTANGSLSYTVTTDTSNPLWSVSQGGYLVPVGQLTATVPIVAAAPGSAYNVQAGTITLIASSVAGFDAGVNNASALTNGFDAETTAAAAIRFAAFLNTRSQATQSAVEYAVATVQQGLSYSIVENPATRNGSFNVYVDDGSGAPTSTLLSTISAAVDLIRPISVTYQILPPNVVYANVSLTIYAANGYNKLTLQPLVSQAIASYINAQGVGQPVSYYDIATVANNIEGVAKIESLLLNGGFQDIGGGVADSVHAQTIAVN